MELSRIKIPLDETGLELTLEIKDAAARRTLADLSIRVNGTMSYVGETTTPIFSGSTVNPIEIDGQDFTATAGTCVSSRGGVFLYSGTTWREFGSVGALRALAYKDSVEAEYTPEGLITRPQFTGKPATMEASVIPRGRIEISQEEAEEGESYNFRAEGTVSAPTITIVPETRTIVAATGVTRPPSCEFPTLAMQLEGEGLSFVWGEGSFDSGSSSYGSEEVTVVTGITEARSTAPVFQGTPQKLSGSFIGQGSQVELEYTPEGEISIPRFEGTPATITSQ